VSLVVQEVKTPTYGSPNASETSKRFPLSVIILTYNEADNIAGCLASVEWADDLIIVDSGSTDGTLHHARKVRPDVRTFVHPFGDFGTQRNWALDETTPKHDWILFLDADERCNSACVAAIREAVTSPAHHVGFYLSYRNFFLGQWIKHCTLYPSWQLRLMKLGEVRFAKEGHGQREVTKGKLGYIREPYDHYGFSKGVAHWIDRHNRYSSEEVELVQRLRGEPLQLGDLLRGGSLARRRCLKRIGARLSSLPFIRLFYLYVLRRGFLDGHAGLVYCLLLLAQDIHVYAKVTEVRSGKDRKASSGAVATANDESVNLAQNPQK
jgi:glycosyltransferase involved in cell wall biosynthesis